MSLKKYLSKNSDDKLIQFIDTLSVTNKTAEYFVNWDKVEENTKMYELELNTLNYLLGKEDIVTEARKLFKSQPELLRAVPILIATRDKELDIMIVDDTDLKQVNLDFVNPNIREIDLYMRFMEKSGLLDFMKNNITNDLVDYVYGVETGLDTNARKNRSGTIMENTVSNFISATCEGISALESISQASAKMIESSWGLRIPEDKASRRYDEAVYDRSRNHLYLIETNYFNGGGSKLKSVSGEFSDLNLLFEDSSYIDFVWVTDGQGWKTAQRPLREAFDKINYIFNLNMLENNYLTDLIIR